MAIRAQNRPDSTSVRTAAPTPLKMRNSLFFCFIYCVCLIGLLSVSSCKTKEAQRPTSKWKDATVMEARAAIADPHTKDDLLLTLLGNVGPVDESPAFWKEIANNPTFSDLHRRRAVMQLFYRHVRVGMTLRELGEVTKGSTWVKDSDIVAVRLFSGTLPLHGTTGNIFGIGVLPTHDADGGYNVWFKMEDGVSRDAIAEAILRGPDRLNSSDAQTKILDIGFSDGYHGQREDSR
jgi:hypothetical protein